jgi:hypothetical protein
LFIGCILCVILNKALGSEGSLKPPLIPPQAGGDQSREMLQVVEEKKINNLQNDSA